MFKLEKKSIEIVIFIAFFSLIFLIYSRGLIEYLLHNKAAGYLVQLVAVLFFSTIVACMAGIKAIFLRLQNNKVGFVLYALFIFVSIISIILTYLKAPYLLELLLFSGVLIFLLSIFIFYQVISMSDNIQQILYRTLFMSGIILFIFALIQYIIVFFGLQANESLKWLAVLIYEFPGHSSLAISGHVVSRPSSLTGSFLHFPLIICLIGIISYRFSKPVWKKAVSILFILTPFLIFSRSGMVIAGFTISGYLFWVLIQKISKILTQAPGIRKKYIIKSFLVLLFLLLICIILFSIPVLKDYSIALFERIFNFHDTGNSIRYKTWAALISEFNKSILVFGEFTGMATNIIRNILGSSKLMDHSPFYLGVTESGFLEILTGFGLLGLLSYYGIWINAIIRLFRRCEALFAFSLIGALIQTLFYQSTEVLPFMFTLSLIPMMVNSKSAVSLEYK